MRPTAETSFSPLVGLRIELLDVEPLVWRRVVVPSRWTLAHLHQYLQWIMGWEDSHGHEFEMAGRFAAPHWWIAELGGFETARRYRDERDLPLASVVEELGSRREFRYAYDMGDGWEHRIVIESTTDPLLRRDIPIPICLAGENACPPEDVGGPHGYAMFLEAMNNPKHEMHETMIEWIGGVFDPRGFDLNRVNREFAGVKTPKRKK